MPEPRTLAFDGWVDPILGQHPKDLRVAECPTCYALVMPDRMTDHERTHESA